MRKISAQILALLLLGGLIVAVELLVGWDSILRPWQTLPVSTVLWAVLMLACSHVFRVIRLIRLFHKDLSEQGWRRFGALFRINALHTAMINFLPMRSGEISFPYLMKKRFRLSLVHSSVGLLCLRIMDLHLLMLLALAGGAITTGQPGLMLLTGIWTALLLLLFPARRWLLGPAWQEHQHHLVRKISQAAGSLPDSGQQLALLYLLGAANWASKLVAFVVIFTAVTQIAIYPSLLALIAGDLSSSLPIHGFAGAGTYEASIVLTLSAFQTDTSLALTGAVNIHLFLLGYTCLQAGLCLLPSPYRAKQVEGS